MSTTTTHGYIALYIYLLLLLSPLDEAMAGRFLPSSVLVSRTEQSESGGRTYVTMKPELNHKRQVFHQREVKTCMPKGFRHSSAPSRYHTLGSLRCTPGEQSKKP
ncbi:unnamed protein product [Ilex paraguariensis]|uniref:Secreted protein n=1 Tax=Ilex paraguariensis TaxID=185542 RepID=A0ABC8TPM8_9AQUA